jgi:flagellar basal body L-ring protein FlgH
MKRSKALLAIPYLMLLGAGGCASWSDIVNLANEDDQRPVSARAPASNGNSKSIVIDERNFSGPSGARPSGPDLGRGEFGVQAKGTGKNKDPWYGTGPVNEGSLWNPESQDGFFFSRNTLHKVGDIIMVKMDSAVNESLNSRIVSIIGPKKSVQRTIAEEAGKSAGNKVSEGIDKIVNNKNVADAIGDAVASDAQTALDPTGDNYVSIDEIPARVVEYLNGGRFRIEGSRKVMIRTAAYQVKLSGTIRDEDVATNNSIDSNMVLESKLELTK